VNRFATAAIAGGVGIGMMLFVGACGSQPQHTAAPSKTVVQKAPAKPVACPVVHDVEGTVYCPVATPPHTGQNNTDSYVWLYFVLIDQQNQQVVRVTNPSDASLRSSISSSTWRAMAPGFTPPSATVRTDMAVKVDPKSAEPKEEPEAVETEEQATAEGSKVQDPATDQNLEQAADESGIADEGTAGGESVGQPGGEAGNNPGSDSSGGNTGGDSSPGSSGGDSTGGISGGDGGGFSGGDGGASAGGDGG
jgi:hypothetical protein